MFSKISPKIYLYILTIIVFYYPLKIRAQTQNIAVNGIAYVWSQNIDEFSDLHKRPEPELNDGNQDSVVWLNTTGRKVDVDIDNAWEAAGVIWSVSETEIKRVVFIHGPFDGDGLTDGAFTKNFHIQVTKDGNTWENLNIQSVPEYIYYTNTKDNEGAEVSDERFVFEGEFGTILGVRVLGQVRTDNSEWWGSYVATCRQIEVYSGKEPPRIIRQPQSQFKHIGETASFSIKAIGVEPLGYQWYRNNTIVNGAQDSIYITEALDENDNDDKVFCKVSDVEGITISDTAQIKINTGSSDTLVLAKNGFAFYSIFYGSNEGTIVEHAALELGQWLDEIAGVNFSVTTDENFDGPKIIIGKNNSFITSITEEMKFDSIKGDGFRILTNNNNIYIAGATERGTMYGVYHFLDIYFGIRWFSPEFTVVPSQSTLTVTQINDLQNPHFMYREIFSGDTEDGYYRAHNRLNGNRWGTHRQYVNYDPDIDTWSEDGPAGGHNVHDIVSEIYHSGGQVKMMAEGTRSDGANYFINLINSEGDERWYAFSQEDNGWDPDPSSRSFADAHGGALSAPLVDMVTDVATRVRKSHPNAHLSTNAYQWSFMPPTGLTVPEFVMVEIAPIEANFGYPYSDVTYNEDANTAFTGWSQIATTLGVWDYNANFQNYLQPLPNIYPMFQNIKYFATLKPIRSYFGQGAYNTFGAEFAELRAWVAARLLWNPDQDYQSLINEFCDGYYGSASTYIKQYIELLHNSFKSSGDRISSKQRITSKYLSLDFILQADQLLAAAEAIATGDYAEHVHNVRLGVDMTILLREHMYEAEAEKRGITWTHDSGRRARFNQYASEARISNYSEDESIDALYAAMNIKRKNPNKAEIVTDEDEWIDYQDMDFSICCGATLIEDLKASDNGAAKLDNGEWAIQMKLDMLPPGDKWTLYAYVRVDVKAGANNNSTAFNMGVHPYSWISPKVSVVKDGNYHVFKFPNMPISYQTGSYIWFSCDDGANYISVDRVVAVRKLTNVKKEKNVLDKFELYQNYPNPFNPSTKIKFSIPNSGNVSLIIYDSLGRKITTLIEDVFYEKGKHSIFWDGKNSNGYSVSTGTYLYKLKSSSNIKTKKMILLK
jgi:hypothetical protein